MTEKLTPEQVQQRLAMLKDWTLDEKFIVRRFKFGSFRDAMRFANAVAEIAEQHNHHPFIAIDYKVVTLRLTSWHAGGLTEADFVEAAEFDKAYGHISTSEQ